MIKKYAGITLRISTMILMILLLFGAWAIQWQETYNSQVFWDDNRVVSGIGFIFAVFGWIMWEMFISSKKRNLVNFIISIIAIFIGTIMINGVIGLIGGFLSLALISATFTLDRMKIIPLKGQAV